MLDERNDSFGLPLVQVAELAELSAHVGHRHVAVEGAACRLKALVAAHHFVHVVEQGVKRDERQGL